MNYTRKRQGRQLRYGRRWSWGLLGMVLVLRWEGGVLGPGRGGDPARLPAGVVLEVPGPVRRPRRRRPWWAQVEWRQGGQALWRGLPGLVGRSGVLVGLWLLDGRQAPGWLVGVGVLPWVVEGVGRGWPRWGRGEGYGWVRAWAQGLYVSSVVSLGMHWLSGGGGWQWAGGAGVGSGGAKDFHRTTAEQRRLLFETWEATGNVSAACRGAGVSRGTFYHWKPRFLAGGYAALEEFASSAPERTRRTDAAVEKQVVQMREEHPDWGKERIEGELSKKNQWVRVVCANTVRRILQGAGLWPVRKPPEKRVVPKGRTAERVGQTENVDLCFVPLEHEEEEKLPAVSGSSGRLLVAPEPAPEEERTWPGQVFTDEKRSYEEAMGDYVAASQQRDQERAGGAPAGEEGNPERRQTRRALRHQEEKLRGERREVREKRTQEDGAWKKIQEQRKQEVAAYRALGKAERKAHRRAHQAREEVWAEQRKQRRETVERRTQEDAQWREQREPLREGLEARPPVKKWLAVLVIVDNCSRQCVGLPVFEAGAHVTAAEVNAALRALLPPRLQFLISDRGVHFTGEDLARLAQDQEFVHVPIARHRPQSNGIAERFVRTFKEWLKDKTWHSAEELRTQAHTFREDYNERPHQGLPGGISPNELARRQGARVA